MFTTRLAQTLGLVLLALMAVPASSDGSAVEWEIRTADLDGSNLQVISMLSGPSDGIAVDPTQGKVYYSLDQDHSISRADLDGSNVEVILNGYPFVGGLALDLAEGKIYWVSNGANNGGPHQVWRADLDGSGVESLVSIQTGAVAFRDVALDLDAGKMYWTDVHRVRRANLDGTDIEELIHVINAGWVGIAIDTAADKMYFIRSGGLDQVHRANTDGSADELLVQESDYLSGIALDTSQGKMYWSNYQNNVGIRVANLDGSDVQTLVGGIRPHALDLDLGAGKIYFTAATVTTETPAVSPLGNVVLAVIVLGMIAIFVMRKTSRARG